MKKDSVLTARDKLTEALRLLTEARDELGTRHEMVLIRTQWMVNEAVAWLDAQVAQEVDPASDDGSKALQEDEVTSDA